MAGSTLRKPTWPWFNWVLLAFFCLLGPGMLIVAGLETVELMRATGRVAATVISVRETRFSSSSPVRYCPTLRWSHRGASFEREMPTCLADAKAFVVGGEVPLRIDPDKPSVVFMDSFEATTGRSLGAFGLAAFGMIGFSVGLRRRWRAARPARDPDAPA